MKKSSNSPRGLKFMDYLSAAQEKFLRANASKYFDMFDLDDLMRVSEFRPQFSRPLTYPLPESGATFEEFFDPIYVKAYRATLLKVCEGSEDTLSNFEKLMRTRVVKAYGTFVSDDLHSNEKEEKDEPQSNEAK